MLKLNAKYFWLHINNFPLPEIEIQTVQLAAQSIW
jgi:hypothetical protein